MKRRAFLTTLGIGAAAAGVASANDFAKPPLPGVAGLDRWRHALAGARLYEITRLREYSAAGRFPKNHRFLGRIPVFIDPNGTPCAVGYLMQRSGHAAVATEVSKSDNHIYVEKIAGGRALDWILFSGLTQTECADIQPSYRRDREGEFLVDPEETQLRRHFAAVEQRLLTNTNASLDACVARLEPLIKGGAALDRIVR